MTDERDKNKGWISRPLRFSVAAFGVISWIAGGIGTFKEKNTVGFTTLIIAGSCALLIAGVGRWPSKFVLPGASVEIPPQVTIASHTLKSLAKSVSSEKFEALMDVVSPKDADILKKAIE